MLLRGVEGWIATVVPKRDVEAMGTYAEAETSLSGHVDEVVVARSHVPVDVVTVTRVAEWSEPSCRAYRNRLSYVNARLSASRDQVHLLLTGRIVGPSSAPIIPR